MKALLIGMLGVALAGCADKPSGNVEKAADATAAPTDPKPVGSSGLPAAPPAAPEAPAAPAAPKPAPDVSDSALTKPAVSDPAYREVTLPAGTILSLQLQSSVGSDTSRVEDPVRATLRRAITVDGVRALPAGATVSGHVTDAKRSARVKGRGRVAFRFNSIDTGEGRVAIRTNTITRVAPGTKKQDAAKIGVGAAGGAIVGGLIGGGDGAAKGAAIGGGAGTAVVLSTRGKEVRVPQGTAISVKLSAPLTVRVKMS